MRPGAGASLVGGLMFQFTHPVWGATRHLDAQQGDLRVSIHAPRVGCDY